MGLQHRYLFVGGLHRSGTSLVARMAAALPGTAGIQGAPVPEGEGAYLQGAIPHDALSGRPMHFATDLAQHLTEGHALDRLETRLRMEADWAPWFAPDAAWRVEKSPVNATRMRLLQQLFPLAQFVLVLRHPEAVAAAVAKWVDLSPAAAIDHWLDAHDRILADAARIHALLVLRYEDIVRDPDAARAELAAFLDVAAGAAPPEAIRDGNRDHAGAPPMDLAQAARAARFGYAQGMAAGRWPGRVAHPLRAVREAVRDARAGSGAR